MNFATTLQLQSIVYKYNPEYKEVYEEYLESSEKNLLPDHVEYSELVSIFIPTGFAHHRCVN